MRAASWFVVVIAVFAVVFVSVFVSGCSHVQAELPGVLDLRSDGRDAVVAQDRTGANDANDDASRDGLMGFFAGPGTQGTSDVTIVDRNSLVLV